MNKKNNHDMNTYFLAGILFLIAGFIRNVPTFYVLGCCMFIMSMYSKNKKK